MSMGVHAERERGHNGLSCAKFACECDVRAFHSLAQTLQVRVLGGVLQEMRRLCPAALTRERQ